VRLRSLPRQRYRKCAAPAVSASQLHGAVVRFGDPLDDDQAKAEAAVLPGTGFVGAVEANRLDFMHREAL